MAGGSGTLDQSKEMSGEQIEKAFAVAWKVHTSPDKANKDYLVEKIRKSNRSEVIISFPGSGTVKDWYSGRPFGETKINLNLFPSLKSIGNNEAALVNENFLQRFEAILADPSLKAEVENAIEKDEQIVFTGHSSGAPVAILATLWTLEMYQTPESRRGIAPLCVTFGSPLVGNHIFSHATRREKWSRYFLHLVMRYDIVPRIFLSPLSSFDQRFEAISQFFNPKSESFMSESIGATSDFYFAIMSNAATVTSHAACKLMGSTDATLETVANFIQLSPYKPFGTYIFCTGYGKEGKQIVIRNPDVVLQLLFFSAALNTEKEAAQVANRSLREHIINGTELQQTLGLQNVVYLDQLEKVPLSDDDGSSGDINMALNDLGLSPRARPCLGAAAELEERRCSNKERMKKNVVYLDELEKVPLSDDDGSSGDINMTLNDLGLSPRARLCLGAAAELEERRCNNEERMKKKKDFVEKTMKELDKYREKWERQRVGYYDAFRVHEDHDEDFQANVKRLELAAVWDEIIEMLRRYELPDEFEGNREWVELGTRFRQLVEPLDIANYYRHLKHLESGPYMVGKGRPKRYKYTQRWLEHAKRKPEEANSESCFWAEVEDLCYITSKNTSFEDVKERVVQLEAQIKTWTEKGELAKDVFLKGSTLVKWWKALPPQHKQESCIRNLIEVQD